MLLWLIWVSWIYYDQTVTVGSECLSTNASELLFDRFFYMLDFSCSIYTFLQFSSFPLSYAKLPAARRHPDFHSCHHEGHQGESIVECNLPSSHSVWHVSYFFHTTWQQPFQVQSRPPSRSMGGCQKLRVQILGKLLNMNVSQCHRNNHDWASLFKKRLRGS
jgi:hypothetical protein